MPARLNCIRAQSRCQLAGSWTFFKWVTSSIVSFPFDHFLFCLAHPCKLKAHLIVLLWHTLFLLPWMNDCVSDHVTLMETQLQSRCGWNQFAPNKQLNRAWEQTTHGQTNGKPHIQLSCCRNQRFFWQNAIRSTQLTVGMTLNKTQQNKLDCVQWWSSYACAFGWHNWKSSALAPRGPTF